MRKHCNPWRVGLRILVGWAIAAGAGPMLPGVRGEAAGQATEDRPNVVLIVADNLGAWALGCYGNGDIRTPNVDRIAAEGVRFTSAFSSNPVCSPTRATLLSGLIPSQHGVHNYLEAGYDTLEEFDTLPEVLGRAGYACGIVGKWHLGPFDQPGQEGFDYWVVKQGGHTPSFYNTQVIDETGTKQKIEGHITPFWTEHALEFIETNRQRPFFLYLTYNGPYGLGGCIEGEPDNPRGATYAGNAMKSFAREPAHPWLRSNRGHIGNVASMRNFASQVSLVDDGVGEVLARLDRLDLARKTLVIFTADQGLACGQGGFWGMGDHTRPRTLFDWTLHIPLVVRQPGRVPAGKTVDQLVCNYDILPSLLSQVGLKGEIPTTPRRPGRDFSPLLRGENIPWEDVGFAEYGADGRTVRTDRWKYVERLEGGPWQLFDLAADPDERVNLCGQAGHAETEAACRERLHKFFQEYADPTWNMWEPGGTSKHLHAKERPATRESGDR
ncbi:MAG: sulfatase family protein [Thermoguttaceae bacterium]